MSSYPLLNVFSQTINISILSTNPLRSHTLLQESLNVITFWSTKNGFRFSPIVLFSEKGNLTQSYLPSISVISEFLRTTPQNSWACTLIKNSPGSLKTKSWKPTLFSSTYVSPTSLVPSNSELYPPSWNLSQYCELNYITSVKLIALRIEQFSEVFFFSIIEPRLHTDGLSARVVGNNYLVC